MRFRFLVYILFGNHRHTRLSVCCLSVFTTIYTNVPQQHKAATTEASRQRQCIYAVAFTSSVGFTHKAYVEFICSTCVFILAIIHRRMVEWPFTKQTNRNIHTRTPNRILFALHFYYLFGWFYRGGMDPTNALQSGKNKLHKSVHRNTTFAFT